MERHYVFQLVDGKWQQLTGWYPDRGHCEETLEDLREHYPDEVFTIMTQTGQLV
jgi:hypothetical protein